MEEGKRPTRGSSADILSISTQAFDLLRTLIESRTGLHYPGERASLLGDKLSDLVARHGLRSYLDLYYMLRYDENRDAMWSDVADHLSVPETFFWRQPEQLLALGEIVPRLLPRAGRVRIWSAACCTGEEPLSIAMALDAAGVSLDRVAIVGTDASPTLVTRAKKGVYGDRAVARLPDELRDRYLVKRSDGWHVDPKLHEAVDWRVANLVEPNDVLLLGRADIIFCRNVFIYFSDETVRRVVDWFADAMPEDGLLFLGAAESLLRTTRRFQLEEVAGAFLYRRTGTSQMPYTESAAYPARTVR